MTNEMIERVARAIDPLPFKDWERRYAHALAHGDNEKEAKDFADMYDGRPDIMGKARAAIEALREPTERMKINGSDVWEQEGQAVAAVYRAMIDAALEDQP